MFPDNAQFRDNLDSFGLSGQFADTKWFSGKVLESGLSGQSKHLKGKSKERVCVGATHWVGDK